MLAGGGSDQNKTTGEKRKAPRIGMTGGTHGLVGMRRWMKMTAVDARTRTLEAASDCAYVCSTIVSFIMPLRTLAAHTTL